MRPLIRRTAVPAALAAVLALTLTACGDDYDEDLVNDLKDQGASQEEAECFIDELGEDDARDFVKLGDAEPAPDDLEKYLDALDECSID